MLTACGIETPNVASVGRQIRVATVLTACGIETSIINPPLLLMVGVATVLTACGIETIRHHHLSYILQHPLLQQCLPLAVLKLVTTIANMINT